MRRWRSERGAALVEAAMVLPILLLISVGIFEFGRAYQTWQVLTNAAREGARTSVLPNGAPASVETRVRQYMQDGQLPEFAAASVTVDRAASITVNGAAQTASQIIIDYPFTFIVLQPVAQLVAPATTAGNPLTMRASALMRNEAQ
jgi:Flp pilus assembly protein TadG